MSNRKSIAGAVAAAALAMCGVAQAGTADGLSLTRPNYLQDAPAKKPLGDLLDKAGVGKTLDDAGITIGGFVEASWTISDSAPPANAITGRYFDFENQDLTLNQIDLYLERVVDPSKGKFDVGGRIEAIYGGDSRLIHSRDLTNHHGIYYVKPGENVGPDEQFDLNQAYLDFALPVGTGLKLRVGKFVTLLGWEVINPTLNAFYSHSFLFGYAIPLTNTGFLATYVLSPSVTVTGGLTRGWDVSTTDDNGSIDFMGQVVWAVNDKSTLYVNLLTGKDTPGDNDHWRTVIDSSFTTKIADQLSVAINGTYGYQALGGSADNAQWYGLAGYATYTISDMFSPSARVEWFNDVDGYRGLGTNVYEATLGVAIKPLPNDKIGSNLVIRPEVRFDYANDRVYDGGTGYSQATFGVDAIFSF